MNTSTDNTTGTDTTFDPPQAAQRNSRKALGFGLTAGLVGGSLAGLVFGMPGLTSAADDGVTVQPAAVVQQVDDPATTSDDEPFVEGDRMREVLQALVDDGTLTADQADAVTAHLVANRPERGGRGDHGEGRGPGGRGGRGGLIGRSGVVTDLLGIDADTLRAELRSGSTLAEIAEANGVSTDALIDALVDEAETRLDQAVENGRLTDEEAATKLAELETKITERVNGG